MLEFVRVLTEDEVLVLKAVHQPESTKNGYFCRHAVTSCVQLAERLEKAKRYSWIAKEAYEKAIEVLKDVTNFTRKKITLNQFLSSLETSLKYLPELESDEIYGGETAFRKLGFIQKKALQLGYRDMLQEQQEEFRQIIKNSQKPFYYSQSRPNNFSDTKMEKTTRNLQGIVSIEMGGWRQYLDLFVPKQVYENAVKPALKDPLHRLKIEVKDEKLIQILDYVFKKTKNLRIRFGNGFRPEFTRPELCKSALQKEMPSLKEFGKLMRPLEGILGRIERRDSFRDKNWKVADRGGYTVYYTKPSWFLPLHHQRLLEQDLMT